MKAVILAGGLGTRLSEETHLRPKPMVEIGGKPILWHIMNIYASHGICDFLICVGYKGYMIKEYFSNYFMHMSDVSFNFVNDSIEFHQKRAEPWRVTIVDTGENTMTGGRIKRIESFLRDDSFCLTYGDGVSDVNITELIAFHKREKACVTLTAVQPPGRYGALSFDAVDSGKVIDFQEKPVGDGAWINGGFFVVQRDALDYITEGDKTVWEQTPLSRIASEGGLRGYKHRGFWRPMDTLRDRNELQLLWDEGRAPWCTWLS